MESTTNFILHTDAVGLQQMKDGVHIPLDPSENIDALIAFENASDAAAYAKLMVKAKGVKPHVYKPLALEAIGYPMLAQIERSQVNFFELVDGEFWTVKEQWFGKNYKA